MENWKLTLNFKAEDQDDAQEQYESAMQSFHSIVDDRLEQVADDGADNGA